MGETLAWWLAVQVMALASLPLALFVFRRLPDAGYAFAKPFGLLLAGYLYWMLLTFHLLPNRPGSVVWTLLILGAISGALYLWRKDELFETVRGRWRVVLAVEVIFTLALFTGAHLRSFIPEIAGTEKPMDFMFLNALDRARYYPPEDPWFAGETVSYYYFGYLINAMIGKLAFQPTAVTFNLALAGTAALAATAAFGLGYNLVALARRAAAVLPFVAGTAAVVFVVLLGNLEGVIEFMAANGLASEGFLASMAIAGLDRATESSTWYPTEQSSFWWWWRATRIAPDANIIMEFPFFSFLLGDLHPHVMAIPYGLTAVALGMALWLEQGALDFDFWRSRPWLLPAAALLVGALGFLNAWDLPTFGFVLALLAFCRNLGRMPPRRALVATARFVAPLAVLAVVLYVPFYATFSSQASGLRPLEVAGTRPLHAFLFWGPLLAVALPLPLAVLLRAWRSIPDAAMNAAVAIPTALFFAWVVLASGGEVPLGDAISVRGWNWLTTLFFALAFVATALALWVTARDEDEDRRALVPPLALTATATLLILGAELFFIRDVFNSRLNTVFKLYYQAWLLLGVAAAFSAFWMYREWKALAGRLERQVRLGAMGFAGVLVAAAMLYPLGATLSRTDGHSRPERTLDGLATFRNSARDDYFAIEWLRERAEPGQVVLEGVGGPYSAFGRVSGWTGIPTVLGWGGHQVQWGRPGQVVGQRERDVERAYSTTSLDEAMEILQQYNVAYVFVGSLERTRYPAAGLGKFEGRLQAVYRSGVAVIYRVPVLTGDSGISRGEAGR